MKKIIFAMLSILFLSFIIAGIINKPGEGSGDNLSQSEGILMKTNCIPPNLKIDPAVNRKFCGSDDCLINFANYWWWTNYEFKGPPNYFYNQGQNWSPRNTFVDGDGLHLMVKKDDLGEGVLRWMASEVVAVFKQDKTTLAETGYGTYLVSARIKSAASWNQLDKNVAFGVFTYQPDPSGPATNPYRELDLAEISRWGTPPCSNVSDPRLCEGNAQFAVQQWARNKYNVHRYTIIEGVSEITLVMKWTNANTPVIFYQYNGIFSLDDLPTRPSNSDTTRTEQNPFIPDAACQLFHLNLWMGNYAQGDPHPGPTNDQVQEVLVTNFQYRP